MVASTLPLRYDPPDTTQLSIYYMVLLVTTSLSTSSIFAIILYTTFRPASSYQTYMSSTEAMQDGSFLMERNFQLTPNEVLMALKSSCWNQAYPARADADSTLLLLQLPALTFLHMIMYFSTSQNTPSSTTQYVPFPQSYLDIFMMQDRCSNIWNNRN